ncbi:MAG: dTDP-4-dehydrorhamnose 3,5-epimerase [Tannerella sp.]|jgi:dTDP-4-dehydrorhamnose 3,5-epimerase|nr:dTDP-4-dehydrorhamnose 3,5-epimerase [Tannerella sp.]
MIYRETEIPGIWIVEPEMFGDARGYFMETYKEAEFERHIGKVHFVQDNESCSVQGVLRGLHYQLEPYAQSKLVRVICGKVLDIAIDIRRGSPAFGKYVAVELSGENRRQLFISKGFAHGFYVMSKTAVFTYKVDNPYAPAHERCIRFDDPAIGIDWHLVPGSSVNTSGKDMNAPLLSDAENNFIYMQR